MLSSTLKSSYLTLPLFTCVMSVVSATASENKTISVGKVSYKGTACPKGSVKVSFTESDKLSVSFRDYSIQAKGRNAKGSRKSCALAILLQVPEGWSVSLENARYRGNLSIPAGVHGRFVNTYSFSGKRGNSYKVNFSGPRIQNFQLKDSISSLANVWSNCGKNAILRINSSMRMNAAHTGNSTVMESTHSLETKLRFRRCYQ